jgi:hypothetical protein
MFALYCEISASLEKNYEDAHVDLQRVGAII